MLEILGLFLRESRVRFCAIEHEHLVWKLRATLMMTFILTALVACSSDSTNTSAPSDVTPQEDLHTLGPEDFTADRLSIIEGESTTLRWSLEDATGVTITSDSMSQNVASAGELDISPTETTTYTLSAVVNAETLTGEIVVTVRPFAAVTLISNVMSGPAPLTVRLSPVVDSVTAINRYFWDFNGDGGTVDGGLGVGANGFDRLTFGARDYDVTGREITYTFDEPGTYNPRIRVWDDAGNQAESTLEVSVTNAPPSAYLRATPTSGQAPLVVSFTVDADDNEGVEAFEWDFNGDGIYDEETTVARASFTYETPGTFQVAIRLTDAQGGTTELAPIHLEVNATAAVVPTVTLSTRTTTGTAPLEVSFTTRTRDPGRSGIVSWEWDFDGDGIVDSTEESSATHIYDGIGNFYPTLRITAEDGSSGTDIMNIITSAGHSFNIEAGAIDPEAGERTSVAVKLGGTSQVGAVIEDASGQLVRTLWPMQNRETGEFSLSWDGKTENGSIPAPGDYYAVLRYIDRDAVETVIDYRVSSGGLIYYPSDWAGSCRGIDRGVEECGLLDVSENEMEPFNNAPTVFSFSNPNNARMTAYVTVIGSEDFAPATFFRSRLMAPGDYEVEWYGAGTNGKLLPRMERNGYLPAIFGLTASDNAIFLTHETTIDSLIATPPVVYPTGSVSNSKSTISFNLSKSADVILTVDDTSNGVEVLRRTFPSVAAGIASIEWDGRGNTGDFVADGGYRINVTARDTYGQSSLPARAMQRIEY